MLRLNHHKTNLTRKDNHYGLTLIIFINQRKQKHLNLEERITIQLRLRDDYSPYKIALELGRAPNTIRNEIKRGTVAQIIQGHTIMVYWADAGEANYNKHRKNGCPQFKRLKCDDFIQYVCKYMKAHNWSVDACVGNALQTSKFQCHEMVCTKTLYNYIDLGLLKVKNIELPMKFKRNTKPKRVRANKRKLGTSIKDRSEHILTREEFGQWEIDTVIGTKDKADRVLLTLAECQTRHYIVRKIASKTAGAVLSEIVSLKEYFGDKFNQVFKSIISDNGLEFVEFHKIEEQSDVKVYFTHPYASSERGTNEWHNGLLRRFIPKGMNINHYSVDEIALVEDWCNTLPRKILGYRTPEELFEEQMDILYAL